VEIRKTIDIFSYLGYNQEQARTLPKEYLTRTEMRWLVRPIVTGAEDAQDKVTVDGVDIETFTTDDGTTWVATSPRYIQSDRVNEWLMGYMVVLNHMLPKVYYLTHRDGTQYTHFADTPYAEYLISPYTVPELGAIATRGVNAVTFQSDVTV
jgi:hypothetical protein